MTSERDEVPFLRRIRGVLHTLHPTERRFADFVLRFPGELAGYTASELARLANVSNATVSRFIRRLGYANYEEARRQVRSEQHQANAASHVTHPRDDQNQILSAHLHRARSDLDYLHDQIAIEDIDIVANAILSARRVWIGGFGFGHPFATYLNSQILQIVESSTYLTETDPNLAAHIVKMRGDDFVVMFSIRTNKEKALKLIEHVQKTNARSVIVTDDDLGRISHRSWRFQCRTASVSSVCNPIPAMAIAHLLAIRVIDLSAPNHSLSTIDTLRHSLGGA
jgi:DNA-binding MurR/RpiR family transcriptional regulator